LTKLSIEVINYDFFSHVCFAASPITRSCTYLDTSVNLVFGFGLVIFSGLKMRPVDISALDFNAAALCDGSNWQLLGYSRATVNLTSVDRFAVAKTLETTYLGYIF